MNDYTTISIWDTTWEELKKVQGRGMSMNDVVLKLLREAGYTRKEE